MNKKDMNLGAVSDTVELHPAVGFFHGVEKLNCAQAILKCFEGPFRVDQQVIEAFKSNGGGRAEEGYCGALYGALFLFRNHPESQMMIKQGFEAEAGFLTCREIKRSRTLSCKECVHLAAQLVEKGRRKMEKESDLFNLQETL